MRKSLRLSIGLPALLFFVACSSPTAPRIPGDGKEPKDPPKDETALLSAPAWATLA